MAQVIGSTVMDELGAYVDQMVSLLKVLGWHATIGVDRTELLVAMVLKDWGFTTNRLIP